MNQQRYTDWWPRSVLCLLILAPFAARGESSAKNGMNIVQIKIEMADATLIVDMDNNPSARDFLALLPLTVSLQDYAATEKISDLPHRLSRDGAPAGMTPAVGDLTYYAPWGNLAIFYRGFRYSEGLIKLGRLSSGVELLARRGPIQARISKLGQ